MPSEQQELVDDVLALQHRFAQQGFTTNTSELTDNILVRSQPKPGEKKLLVTDWKAMTFQPKFVGNPDLQNTIINTQINTLLDNLNLQV